LIQDADGDLFQSATISLEPNTQTVGGIGTVLVGGKESDTILVRGAITLSGNSLNRGSMSVNGGLSANQLTVVQGATFSSRAAMLGGLSTHSLWVSQGATFNSSAAFAAGLTASRIYASGATFAGVVALTAGAFIRFQDGTTMATVPTGSGGGGYAYTVSSVAPASPTSGEKWYDLESGVEFTYIFDGDSSQWLELNSGLVGPTGATGPLPPNFVESFNSLTGAVVGVGSIVGLTGITTSATSGSVVGVGVDFLTVQIKIPFGTATPSGGTHGDYYVQYIE
jgi:hypothetical protein